MAGIDRTKPEDMKPIDAAAYLCWGSGRGDLYDAIHAMKKDNERLREALRTIAMSHLEKDDRNSGWGYCISIARSALQQKESEE